MATMKDGILGGLSGKIGNVVGSTWRGKNVLRSAPSTSKKPASKAQKKQRDKFKNVSAFLIPIKGILTKTFGAKVGVKSPYNFAMSYHMKEAVQQTPAGFQLEYSKILIGKGGLCGIENPVVQTLPTHRLQVSWDDNSTQGLAYPTDAFLIVAYALSLQSFTYAMGDSVRETGQGVLNFQESFYGETVHVWTTFYNAKIALAATSNYLGFFVIE